MFGGLRWLRLPLLIAVAVLLGILTPQSAVNAKSPFPFLATIWSDTRPRAMNAGSTYIITVNFSNAGQQEETINFRVKAWCYMRGAVKVDFNTEWETLTIPRGGKQPGQVAKTHEVSVKVPTRCSPPMEYSRVANTYSSTVGFEIVSVEEGRYQGFDPFNNYVYAPSTKDWYRYNLLAKEPHPTTTGKYQAHHMLPQKFEQQFNAAGLNIHSPIFLRWWCSDGGVRPRVWRQITRVRHMPTTSCGKTFLRTIHILDGCRLYSSCEASRGDSPTSVRMDSCHMN